MLQLNALRVSGLAKLCALLEAKRVVSSIAASLSKSEVDAKAKAAHNVALIKPAQSKAAINKGGSVVVVFVDNAPRSIKCGLAEFEAEVELR